MKTAQLINRALHDCAIIMVMRTTRAQSEEVRHACTNHYKFSALMSLWSRDNLQAKCTEVVVIRARMSDLLWCTVQDFIYEGEELKTVNFKNTRFHHKTKQSC